MNTLGYTYNRAIRAHRCTCCEGLVKPGRGIFCKQDDLLCRSCYGWVRDEALDRIQASVARMRAGIVARVNAKRGCVDSAARF